jgi:hypothetical protein
MKAFTILAGVILPLLVGLLHHDVRDAISAGRWPTVAGMVLGFNGLFALIGGILATVFSVKLRPRAAWICVGIATVVSGALSASSGAIKERVEVMSQESDAQKITTWNQRQHGKALLGLQTCGRPSVKVWRYGSGRAYEVTASGLSFTGTFENKSAEKIVAVVIDFKIANKDQKQVIVSRRLRLPMEVFPTASITFEKTFAPDDYADGAIVDEIHRAAEQLGAAYSWTYEFVAAIPQSLESIDLRKSLKVEAALSQKE